MIFYKVLKNRNLKIAQSHFVRLLAIQLLGANVYSLHKFEHTIFTKERQFSSKTR